MSKEALCILSQIWSDDEQYQDKDNHIAFVAKALENPKDKTGKSQGMNFLYANPEAKVCDQLSMLSLPNFSYLGWQRTIPVVHHPMPIHMAS